MDRSWDDVKAGDVVFWNGHNMKVHSKGTKAFCLVPMKGGHGNMVKRTSFEYNPRNSYSAK